MTQSFQISADHRGFYRDGKRFFPKIQNLSFPLHAWSDTVLLPLRASLKDDLDWSAERECAEKIVVEGRWILWEIDFEFPLYGLHHRNSSAFFTYARALEEFARFSSAFSQNTFGVCLYRGDMHFSSLFDLHGWEEIFYDWLEALIQTSHDAHELKNVSFQREEAWMDTAIGNHYLQLFSTDVFAGYLHRLISYLPDDLLPFAFFDVSAIHSSAYSAQLLSKERFQYLYLGLKKARFPFNGITLYQGASSYGWLGDEDCPSHAAQELPSLGIYLPSDSYCDRKILAKLDAAMDSFQSKEMAFRILSEEKLTEEWDGLDRLVVITEAISPSGKRKLQGFAAAGGEVIYL